jgi:hypothetical protein
MDKEIDSESLNIAKSCFKRKMSQVQKHVVGLRIRVILNIFYRCIVTKARFGVY